jgi:hypothetical protein
MPRNIFHTIKDLFTIVFSQICASEWHWNSVIEIVEVAAAASFSACDCDVVQFEVYTSSWRGSAEDVNVSSGLFLR